MNKKIKMLIQKYDKDMKFENRFDELKDKLDLIPEADIKSEVFTIKRKVMPAYMMMIVLLMLITGIIGLQFGLNSSFVVGPNNLDAVELELMELVDVYDRESLESLIVDDHTRIQVYMGIENGNNVLIFRTKNSHADTEISISINSLSINLTDDIDMMFLVVTDIENISINIVTNHANGEQSEVNYLRDYSSYFNYLGR